METKKLDSIRMGCSYVSPEVEVIDIATSQNILQGSDQNMDPENGTW